MGCHKLLHFDFGVLGGVLALAISDSAFQAEIFGLFVD